MARVKLPRLSSSSPGKRFTPRRKNPSTPPAGAAGRSQSAHGTGNRQFTLGRGQMIGLGRYFAVAGVLLVVGCGFELSGLSKSVVVGSGKVASEVRAVAGISSVSCEGSGEIELVQDGTESLKITAEDNILPYLTSVVDGGKLTLSLRKDVSISTTKP